jgi:hypothetical protein
MLAGTRAAGVEHRAPVGGRGARIAARVVGVQAVAAQRVVVAGHAVGDEVGQLREHRLGEDHGTGLAQLRGQRRLVGWHQALERHRPAGGRHVAGVDVVLECHRDAVQRPAQLAGRAFGIEPIGLLQRLGVDRQRGVHAFLVERDPPQVLLHQLARGHAAVGHGLLHLGEARLDHRERRRRRRRRGRTSGQEDGQEQCNERTNRHRDPHENHGNQRGRAGCSGGPGDASPYGGPMVWQVAGGSQHGAGLPERWRRRRQVADIP